MLNTFFWAVAHVLLILLLYSENNSIHTSLKGQEKNA